MNIREYLDDYDTNILVLDGFDEALVGIVEMYGRPPIACYDMDIVFSILTKDMSLEEAAEHFEYNIIGSYVGEYTPCFINVLKDEL